jgi:alginate O-acetyltransferase complex protein AlgI
VIWGLYHGAFLVAERLGLAAAVRRLWTPLRHGYLMAVVMVGWVFFRADTLAGAVAFLGAMFGMRGASPTPFTVGWYLTPELYVALIAGTIGSVKYLDADLFSRDGRDRNPRPHVQAAATAALALVFLASILQIASRSYDPFIYFRF